MGIIYKVTSPSGKSYVGQTTTTFEKRWRDHKYDALDPNKNRCRLLNIAIRKYGIKSFTNEILIECQTEELNDYELKLIKEHNTLVPSGYNLKIGGESNYTHSEETKQRISNTLAGKQFTPDQILQRSQTRKKSDLPMFLCERRKNNTVVGYRVKLPGMRERTFIDSRKTLDQKYEEALKYLTTTNMQREVCID